MMKVAKRRGCAVALPLVSMFACGLTAILAMQPAFARCVRIQDALAYEGVNLASGSFGEKDRLGDDYEYPTKLTLTIQRTWSISLPPSREGATCPPPRGFGPWDPRIQLSLMRGSATLSWCSIFTTMAIPQAVHSLAAMPARQRSS